MPVFRVLAKRVEVERRRCGSWWISCAGSWGRAWWIWGGGGRQGDIVGVTKAQMRELVDQLRGRKAGGAMRGSVVVLGGDAGVVAEQADGEGYERIR